MQSGLSQNPIPFDHGKVTLGVVHGGAQLGKSIYVIVMTVKANMIQ